MEIDFSKFTSIKIGPKLDVKVVDERSKFDGIIIGGGNNLLIADSASNLGVLDNKFDFLKIENDKLIIGAKCSNAKIYNFCKKNNIANFEFLRNIPGELGGLLKMNAGLLNFCISDNLVEICIDNKILKKEEILFEYRKTNIKGIIFFAKFNIKFGFNQKLSDEIFNKRINQPKANTFGSVFKNPKGNYAAKLIEDVGLKGYRINDISFSKIHSNFLINHSHAIFDDALYLIELAKYEVFNKFKIKLDTEVVIIK